MDNGESSYRRFLDGDEHAFDDILDLYQKNIIFFICGIVKDEALAEDIAADTFAHLIVHPEKFRTGGSLKSYLYTIARSRAIDALRKRGRESVDRVENIDLLSDLSTLPDELLVQREQYSALHASLDKLDIDKRTALILIYVHDMSYDEVGKIMKKSRKKIENLVYSAKKAIRLDMEREFGDKKC